MSQDVQILQLSAEGQVTRQQRLTVGERVRDVRQGPDDLIYILTDEQDGKVYRVRPQ
jgi:glucose/arabinose dehydrogenase